MPLREVIVKRALWNMPRVNPEDYKKPTSSSDNYQSPSLSLSSSGEEGYPQSPIAVSTPPPCSPPLSGKAKKQPSQLQDAMHKPEHILADKNEEPLWVDIPACSAPEKIKQLHKEWNKNPNLCRYAKHYCKHAIQSTFIYHGTIYV